MEMVKAYAEKKAKVNKLKRTLEENGKSDKEKKAISTTKDQGKSLEEALSMEVSEKVNDDKSPSKPSKTIGSLLKSRSIVVAAVVLVLGGRLVRASAIAAMYGWSKDDHHLL
eukprot:4270167-Ditylum_brightwellii.AAC.1